MILVYMIQELEPTYMTAYTFSADIRPGEALGRSKFPHLPAGLLKEPPPAISLTPQDRRILMALVMHQKRGGSTSLLSGTAAYTIMRDMIETGRCYAKTGKGQPLTWEAALPATPTWTPSTEPAGFKPVLQLEAQHPILPSTPPLALNIRTASCHPVTTVLPEALATIWQVHAAMTPEDCLTFIERLTLEHPHESLPAPPHIDEKHVETVEPRPILTLARQGSARNPTLLIRVGFQYGQRVVAAASPGDRVRFVNEGTLVNMARNHLSEEGAKLRLGAFGFITHHPKTEDLFARVAETDTLTLPETGTPTWADVVQNLLPELTSEGWDIRHEAGCKLVAPSNDDWYSDFTTTAKGWLAFESGVCIDGERVNLLPFLQRYLRDHRDTSEQELEAQLADSTIPIVTSTCIALIDGPRLLGMIQQLFELYSDTPLDRESRLRISEWRAAELAQNTPGSTWEPPPELAAAIKSLKSGIKIEPQSAPEGMDCELRPYQAHGLGWLGFLRDHGLGGILADDMGLGKTIQAIGLIQQDKLAGKLDLPVLIVAPTSVLPNWRNELTRFAPSLRAHILHGPHRHTLLEDFSETDVVITSYALLRRDSAIYHKQTFSYVILDEAQAIKNPKTKVTRVAYALKARTRLCLTGTPIENHLGELWSLMNFALPGLLGTESSFQKIFQKPIEQDGHPVVRQQLQTRIKPLLLRRTKDRVATELPPKNVIIQTIALSEAQVDLYQTIRMAMTERIQDEMQAKGLQRSRIMILAALLKLRQICCDPRLVDKKQTFTIPEDSCKLKVLEGMLPDMVEEGRRILIFSQFTSMLDLIKAQLKKQKLPFVEIRGSTRDRETPVRDFQAGKVPIFLISLKAGGTGLNLTAADIVIHYDPWWNPAVEAQATDRAHRIGQDKPIFVYKFVTEGTVEARILKLQEKKRALTEIMEDAGSGSLAFSQADLNTLLAAPDVE
jgi:hypothetical protein